jgi:hypothetical protein
MATRARAPYDGSAVTNGPDMNHHPTREADWRPCRHHLFELYEAVTPNARHRIRWRIAEVIWERIKADADLGCEWEDTYPNGDRWQRHPTRTLLGQHVDLVPDGGPTVQITITSDCKPGK